MKSSLAIQRYYDRWDTYDKDLRALGFYVPDQLVKLTKPFLAGYQTILDVGCGTGLVGQALRRHRCRGYLVGIDLSQARLDQAAKKKVYERLHVNNATQIAERDESFDVVLSSAVLGLAGPRAFRQIVKKVRRGGLISVAVGDLKTNTVCHQRYLAVVSLIRRLTNLIILREYDLGSGYSDPRQDENYRLFIILRRDV